MNFLYVPIGVLIGIVVAAPIGPVNLIAINRTLKHGMLHGVLAGLGGALGDGLFAVVAAYGLSALSELVVEQKDLLRLIGGCIMVAFAFFVWRAQPKLDKVKETPEDTPHLMLLAFMMTITNPATLMGFTAIFAGAGFHEVGSGSGVQIANAGILVAGVFLGSLIWWGVICWVVSHVRHRIGQKTFTMINHVCAAVLLLFGVGAIIAGLTD